MTSTWPVLTRKDVIAFQFSSWFSTFSSLSIKSTIIPLPDEFRSYLEADGVFVPAGSENSLPKSTLRDDNADDDHSDTDDQAVSPATHYAFPELDAHIRAAIEAYGGGVFPKLNFSSPKDAAWLLPSSQPLRCTSPADVYMLLKSSDFISHDLSAESVFEGCADIDDDDDDDDDYDCYYKLELVLRKGSRSTPVARCALLCAMACSSAYRSAMGTTTSF